MEPQADTLYKGQNGVLAVSKDRNTVAWRAVQSAEPSVTITVSQITNLQQTPETASKVMLKIFTQEPGQTDTVHYVFTFTAKTNARLQANSIKDVLATAIQAHKTAQAATSAAATADNSWEDDEKLKLNVGLQQSFMKANPSLQKIFMEALTMKPSTTSTTQFTSQFWAARVNQLRAHAIAQNQERGKYNVFSELKKEDGGRKINLTSDHVRMIFQQYPIMKTVYEEIVPHRIKDETDFWSRFFQSQLYMALRGLKFDRSKDARDPVLDQYLDHPMLTGIQPASTEIHIPKFIDLEGNEENHSQKKGNRPDFDLRVSALEKAPIIRRLNALSQNILATVKPSDVNPSAPIGMDEATYEQLRLRDLAGDPEQNRIILNIRDQSRFFADNRTSTSGDLINKVDPEQALRRVCQNLAMNFPQPGARVLPIDEYEQADEDDEDDPDTAPSGAALATKHILSLVNANSNQTAAIPESSGLSSGIYDRVIITHNTTLEFQRQFWDAFLSGDAARATEVVSSAESLNKALERINFLADEAEKERKDIVDTQEAKAREYNRKFGKKMRVDYAAIGGGGDVVRQLLGPMINSVKSALVKFNEVYQEQLKESQE